MRHLHFYLFGFAALVAACQPVTPTTVNSKAAPTITVAPEGQTDIDLVVSTVTKTADGTAGSGSGTEAGSGTNNSSEETAIAAIPGTPPVQPTPVQPVKVQPPFRPKAMIGSASIFLVRDLGIATMIRQEGPIEIWQYRFAACVVDFFFYPVNQGSSQLVIKDWDMRSAVIGGRVNEGKCLAAMDQHHQKLVAGS
ncbi:hypothetical protein [Candidatus Ponderosibacter sp. Uisw_141_02]|uniref:hypothetical protein n=1 Tax=Candidatus Ponderosibacter sp. Uisw_141_02 TaxID=3231000 RepID=UPI003D54E8C8